MWKTTTATAHLTSDLSPKRQPSEISLKTSDLMLKHQKWQHCLQSIGFEFRWWFASKWKSSTEEGLVHGILTWGPWTPNAGFLKRGPRSPMGATERFSRGHEHRPLLSSSAVILQNPIDEQGATSVGSLWKGATNH